VVILNHPRDLHLGFRPFGPEHYHSVTGENLDGWTLFANGLEVVNSGAQQTDVLLVYRDWFALLNRGMRLTPVGSSDSHDVSRFIAGQARTYLRAADEDPGKIDVGAAVRSFLEGRVLVSCGLLVDIAVDGAYGPGDLVPASGGAEVAVSVLGPGWATAERVSLYSNGVLIREAPVPAGDRPGVKWRGEWTLPRSGHDAWLVAVATGPGLRAPYWPIARPYQPATPLVDRRVIGSTGAVWIDGDGDGQRTCARDYARSIREAVGTDPSRLARALGDHDEAVAAQAAGLLAAEGVSVDEDRFLTAARGAGPQVERGFRTFIEAWRESQRARRKPEGAR
jgi:hypothetical protein